MKKPLIIACVCILACQKELSDITLKEKNEIAIVGTWRLLSMTDNFHKTFTNADPCFADDRLELNGTTAIISQGDCIGFPGKDKEIQFTWRFLSDDTVDMGGDTVKIITLNHTSMIFKRDDPQFLEYHWKKP